MYIFVLILSLLQTSSAQSPAEPSAWTFNVGTTHTSDEISLNHQGFSYISHKRDLSWPYKNEVEKAWDWGISLDHFSGSSQAYQFEGQKLLLLVGQKISTMAHWQVQLGQHSVQAKPNSLPSKVKMIGDLKLDGYLFGNKQIYGRYNYNSDLAYSDLALPKALTKKLGKEEHNIKLQYSLESSWRFIYTGHLTHFSDENNRRRNQIETMYAISPYEPWIWLGFIANHWQNSKQSIDYWTPEQFISVGLKLDANVKIWQHLNVFAEVQFSQLKENELDWGNGSSFFGGLQYGDRNELQTKLSIGKINSAQSGNSWQQEGFYLSIAW